MPIPDKEKVKNPKKKVGRTRGKVELPKCESRSASEGGRLCPRGKKEKGNKRKRKIQKGSSTDMTEVEFSS